MGETGEDISQGDIDTEHPEGFSSGKYHDAFGRVAESPHQRKYLKNVYQRSLKLVEEAGWGNPILRKHAEVLLCGTGSSETSSTFVDTIRELNPNAKVHILDREQFPLDKSRERLQGELATGLANIEFHHEDALHTSFDDSSLSAIETDLFLQFFSPDAKQALVREWARILEPGGIITTRDFVQSTGGPIEKRASNLHQRIIAKRLHVPTYPTTSIGLSNLFKEAGLEVRITPVRLPIVGAQIPLFSHIIAHKLETPSIE